MSQPLVSIVTPSYNQARFLKQTLETVIQQDYQPLEYIVMDGGSTDGSVELIREYEDRIAYWVSEPDRGQADAIQRGWSCSRGDILAWINSDDYYAPDAVTRVVEVFRQHPEVDVVVGDCIAVDENGRFIRQIPGGIWGEKQIMGNTLPQQSIFCRRVAIEAVGGLTTHLRYVMDWDLWLRLWLNGARFYHLAYPIGYFRIWGQSKTALGGRYGLSGGIPFALERVSVLASLSTSSPYSTTPEKQDLLNQAWLVGLLELALLHYSEGNAPAAQQYIAEFAQHNENLDSLPAPDILALHLAYQDKVETIVTPFINELAINLEQRHISINPMRWQQQLNAEIYLMRAWAARFSGDLVTAVAHFGRAIRYYPALAMQRRVLSPVIKTAIQVPVNYIKRLTLRGTDAV